MKRFCIFVLSICFFALLFIFDLNEVSADSFSIYNNGFYVGNSYSDLGSPSTITYGPNTFFNLKRVSVSNISGTDDTVFHSVGLVNPIPMRDKTYIRQSFIFVANQVDVYPSLVRVNWNSSIYFPVTCSNILGQHSDTSSVQQFYFNCYYDIPYNISDNYQYIGLFINHSNKPFSYQIYLNKEYSYYYYLSSDMQDLIKKQLKEQEEINDSIDEIIELLKKSNDTGLDDDTMQQPDSSSYDDYNSSEESLKGVMSSGADFSNVSVSLDSGTNNFVWDLVTRFVQSNSLVFGLIISILSIGIIKLVFNR